MIVDEADMEMEMAIDPFIEAGIDVPANLPYQDSTQEEESYKKVVKGEGSETPTIARKIRKISHWGGARGSDATAVPNTTRTRNNSIVSTRSGLPRSTSIRKRTTRYISVIILGDNMYMHIYIYHTYTYTYTYVYI